MGANYSISSIYTTLQPYENKNLVTHTNNIGKTIIPYETTESWIQFFKEKGMRIFYLSNYSNEMYRQSKDRLTFLENFDGGIFSWKEKCMKPDEEIYKRLLKRYDIVPERAIFLMTVWKILKLHSASVCKELYLLQMFHCRCWKNDII